jgi:hypothetical protein
MSDTQHFADTRSGIKPGEGKSTPQFAVTLTDGEWDRRQTNGCLMPDTAPGTFKSVGEARAWCQRREDELSRRRRRSMCRWSGRPKRRQVWFAANTAGHRN